jgi:hypothetical protein
MHPDPNLRLKTGVRARRKESNATTYFPPHAVFPVIPKIAQGQNHSKINPSPKTPRDASRAGSWKKETYPTSSKKAEWFYRKRRGRRCSKNAPCRTSSWWATMASLQNGAGRSSSCSGSPSSIAAAAWSCCKWRRRSGSRTKDIWVGLSCRSSRTATSSDNARAYSWTRWWTLVAFYWFRRQRGPLQSCPRTHPWNIGRRMHSRANQTRKIEVNGDTFSYSSEL